MLFRNQIQLIPQAPDPATLPHDDPQFKVFGPFVIAEGVLGIPKKELHVVFQIAVRELDDLVVQQHYQQQQERETGPSKDYDAAGLRMMQLSTLVCIVTTENLTAVNIRKRFILASFSASKAADATTTQGDDTTTEKQKQAKLIQDELRWLNILFGSPLHKHTKSPMLWQHRRWLLELAAEKRIPLAAAQDQDLIKWEMELVLKAAELHPKNYYAWSYARWLVLTYMPSSTTTVSTTDTTQPDPVLDDLLSQIFSFSKSHISDISAWTFLYFLLAHQPHQAVRLEYLNDTIEYLRIVPGHEAVWVFVRMSLARFWGRQEATEMVKRIEVREDMLVDLGYKEKAVEWLNKFA